MGRSGLTAPGSWCDRTVTMAPTEDPLDLLAHALADPIRRSLWTGIGRRPGATTAELADAHPQVTRWAVMKHLAVLRRAEALAKICSSMASRSDSMESMIGK